MNLQRCGATAGKLLLLAAIGVLLSELLLRLPIPFIGYELPRVPDPILNHRWRANAVFTLSWYEALGVPAYERRTNAHSWFSPPVLHEEKREGEFRIFFVGDSYVEGISPQDQTMPAEVEVALARKSAQDPQIPQITVVNTGTFSYSPTIYYLLLQQKILPFKPDLVVLSVAMNDVFDDFVYAQSLVRDSSGRIIAAPAGGEFSRRYVRTTDFIREKSPLERFFSLFEGYSRIARTVNVRLFDFENGRRGPAPGMPAPYDWCHEPWSKETEANVRHSLSLLNDSIALLKSQRIPVVVSAIPMREHFSGAFATRPLDEVKKIAIEQDVRYFDLYQFLQVALNGASAETIYIPHDMHFSKKGNEFWAKGILDFIAQRELAY